MCRDWLRVAGVAGDCIIYDPEVDVVTLNFGMRLSPLFVDSEDASIFNIQSSTCFIPYFVAGVYSLSNAPAPFHLLVLNFLDLLQLNSLLTEFLALPPRRYHPRVRLDSAPLF